MPIYKEHNNEQLQRRDSSNVSQRQSQTEEQTPPIPDVKAYLAKPAQLAAFEKTYLAKPLQFASYKPDPSPLQQRETKTGLPDNLKSGIESLSGHSMDDVKVHYNSTKPTQLQAHAYAQGTDIHLASGQEQHLPHEAWHVIQQKQGRVKPTTQMKGININDDAGLEREADEMGKKANSIQLKSDKETPSNQVSPHPNNVTTQMVMKPHIVLGNAHLRAVEGGKIKSGWFGKTKIGDRIPYNTEIEADKEVTYEGGTWIKAKYGGNEGAIRATKIMAKQVMTKDEIDAVDDASPATDKVAMTDKIAGVTSKVLGKDEYAYKRFSDYDEDTETYAKDNIEDWSKFTSATNSGASAIGDLTGMILAGRKLKTTWKEKRWDWDLASTGLKILKSGSSLVKDASDAYSMGSKLINNQGKKTKTPADAVSKLFGKISGSVGVLKDIIDIIATSIKVYKKQKAKDITKLFKNIGKLGQDIFKLLAKFKAISKEGKAFKTTVPFLGAIISGAEAILAWLKIGESKIQAKAMSGKSNLLRYKLVSVLGQDKVNGFELLGNKSDNEKIFHEEKRGMMGYRKNYVRVNASVMNAMNNLCNHAVQHVTGRKQEVLDWFDNLSVEKAADKAQKAKLRKVLVNMKDFHDGKTKIEKLKNEKEYQSESMKRLIQFLLPYMKRKATFLEVSLEGRAKRVSSNKVVQERLVSLASNISTHHQLFEIQKLIQEYELADKLSEINQKRESLGKDNMLTSILSVIGELTGSISAFFTAGAGTVAGKIISGAGSAYQGTRATGKFLQQKVGRKFGILGGDKSRSKDAKHKEYVKHAKFLTKMWIDETDKDDLDEAKGDLDKKKENLTAGLEKVKSYVEATGLKTQDAVEAPAMQIPDMIVDALKDR